MNVNELREAIFEEVYAGRNGDVYEDCYEATDRIIAIIREALLSEEAVEAANSVSVTFHDGEGAVTAALAAAGLTNDPA